MTQKKARPGARGLRKVKTGCETCKIRRKKCDEAKPSCSQCCDAGWKCDFATNVSYAAGIASGVQETPMIACLMASRPVLPCTRLEELDLQLFSYFQLVSGKEFTLFFDDPTWEHRVLQRAHMEPCIHHASLAISALSLDQNSAGTFWKDSRQSCSAIEYSTKQYNLAIQSLNRCMETSLESAEVLMIGIFMFIHIEFMRGYQEMVFVHLRGASTLLNTLKMVLSSRNYNYLETALAHTKSQMEELKRFHALQYEPLIRGCI